MIHATTREKYHKDTDSPLRENVGVNQVHDYAASEPKSTTVQQSCGIAHSRKNVPHPVGTNHRS